MPGITSLALALSLALAPSRGPLTTETTLEACRDRGEDLEVSYGPRDAPLTLTVYVDPVQPNQLQLWLEARRIAGEREDELRLELVVARGGVVEGAAPADSVRVWFMALAAMDQAEAALRLLEHHDWMRVASQLTSPEGRAALARELELDPGAIEARRSGVPGQCLGRRLDHEARALAALTMDQPATVVVITNRFGDQRLEHVDLELTELRSQLDRARKVDAFSEGVGFVPFGPSVPSQGSRLDRTFPDAGVLVGGAALPHRLLLFIEDEEHGKLPTWLEPAMAYRSENPGMLSVQVIAAGVGTRAIRFRRRLCAARTLGLEVEFLDHLALRPAARRLYETDLNEVLQPVADSDACSDSEPLEDETKAAEAGRRGTDFGHPRGAWLDGRPVDQADLRNLEWELSIQIAPSVIDWLAQPDATNWDIGGVN